MNKPQREGFVDDTEPSEPPILDAKSLTPEEERRLRRARDSKPHPALIEQEREPEPTRAEPEATQPKQEKAAPEVVQPEPEKWPMIIELRHKKLTTPEAVIDKLMLQEPTAGDIAKAGGNPVSFEMLEVRADGMASFKIVIDDKKMMGLIALLSGVLPTFINKMDPRDYNSAAYRLRRFFMPEQGLW